MNIFISDGFYLKSQNTEKFQKKVYNDFIKYKNFKTLNHSEEEMKRLFNNEKTVLFTIVNNSYVIGYLIGEFLNLEDISLVDNRFVFYITYIHVSKNFRNRNYGQKLLNSLYSFINNNNYNIDGYMLRYNIDNNKLKYFYEKNYFMRDLIINSNSDFDIFYKKL